MNYVRFLTPPTHSLTQCRDHFFIHLYLLVFRIKVWQTKFVVGIRDVRGEKREGSGPRRKVNVCTVNTNLVKTSHSV